MISAQEKLLAFPEVFIDLLDPTPDPHTRLGVQDVSPTDAFQAALHIVPCPDFGLYAGSSDSLREEFLLAFILCQYRSHPK